jgi:hypothetical protein
MSVDNSNNRLTIKPLVAILSTLSHHVAVGIGISCIGEKSPLSLTVFFRSLFSINAGLIRVQFVMVDCFRETLRSLTRSYTGMPTSLNPPPMIGIVGSGKPSFIGVTTMSQNNSQDNNFAQHIFEQLKKKPIAIDFSHRLSDTDLSRTVDLTNTVDLMARRATSILYALSVQFADKGNVRLSDDVLVGLVDSAIQEITDINNVVSAFHAMNNEVQS